MKQSVRSRGGREPNRKMAIQSIMGVPHYTYLISDLYFGIDVRITIKKRGFSIIPFVRKTEGRKTSGIPILPYIQPLR